MGDAESFERQRRKMVRRQIAARGVSSERVLDAMRAVRREGFVPSYLGEFAYDDAPLPIEEEQTISQPYIVAFMVEALELEGHERVLEIGTGSGYAAAVLAEVARDVYTIERHERLARTAEARLAEEGYEQVHVRCGDGTLGWPEEAPFDAIVVAAGGPAVPDSLREQLAIGGRLVIPVGEHVGQQTLRRITRLDVDEFRDEDLGGVRFVPLVGAEGWHTEARKPRAAPARAYTLSERLAKEAESFGEVEDAPLEALLERIGDARVVLLGEATHGTSEFYRMRARITRALVERKGFNIVTAEADWPDAARVDHYVRDRDVSPQGWQAFARFPTWMWRNQEFHDFVEWLRAHNADLPREHRVRFAGLDLYSLYTSISEVLLFLDSKDPQAARVARERYGCLTPWQSDPAAYGRAALSGEYRSCEGQVVKMLESLLRERMRFIDGDPESLFNAVQNARLVADAERYYRIMYYGHHQSWNLRDTHMFQTLQSLLRFGGPDAKAVVWEHNSHVGDARATEMSARGELNVGELCRREFGDAACLVGFGTDHGTVAAASYWGGPMEVKAVQPGRDDSYENLFHDSGAPGLLLGLRDPLKAELRDALSESRLERAIGVIYRPETELASHYFRAVLPRQFDEFVWLDETRAVEPLGARTLEGVPDTYPFGL
ncbi:MAG: protein-L-isoaspartate(D-aspartate) O-methyltransferase [Deltaproteobacteria bacterium]|nr:protein-L-isoaspartate(D-aspartate) O-methyltransferase [Deltaproteobacteria bacterium]MBW2414675.1 protein-L-isoaspartate(D-aspartate) O-methyltransferase [Deltaproteobacteria bacterium]